VTGIAGLAFSGFTLKNPDTLGIMKASTSLPISVLMGLALVNGVVIIICGAAILKRINWGRIAYVAITGVILLITFVTSKQSHLAYIPQIAIFILVTFFLFRQKANLYFKNGS
jgi:hypothetical protein